MKTTAQVVSIKLESHTVEPRVHCEIGLITIPNMTKIVIQVTSVLNNEENKQIREWANSLRPNQVIELTWKQS